VNEEDRRPLRVASLFDVDANPAPTYDCVCWHHDLPGPGLGQEVAGEV
jgi:hypothetical protein